MMLTLWRHYGNSWYLFPSFPPKPGTPNCGRIVLSWNAYQDTHRPTREMKALSFVVLGTIGQRSIYTYYRTAHLHLSCAIASKLLQDDGYAFEVASHVVDHFLSSASTNEYPPLLRRVMDDTINIDEEAASTDWINQLFVPIYGMSGNLIRPNNSASISPNNRSTRRSSISKQRTNLKITLAYRGKDFCGWEDQRHDLYRSAKNDGERMNSCIDQFIPALPSVQGTLADALHTLLATNNNATIITDHTLRDDGLDKSSLLQDSVAATLIRRQHRKHNTHSDRPIEIKVAGRTDAGVSAIGQVCRIRTWSDITNINGGIEKHVQQLVNEHIAANRGGGISSVGLHIQSVECVGDEFHPTFGATARAYVYLFDLPMNDDNNNEHSYNKSLVSVPRMNALLQTLVNRELDYIGMSYGKVKSQTTLCILFHARASIVELVCCSDRLDYDGGSSSLFSKTRRRAICIELVGDRFLRRMVRILVATVMREANCSSYVDFALLNIIHARDRSLAASPAPPDGLLFVGADFSSPSKNSSASLLQPPSDA